MPTVEYLTGLGVNTSRALLRHPQLLGLSIETKMRPVGPAGPEPTPPPPVMSGEPNPPPPPPCARSTASHSLCRVGAAIPRHVTILGPMSHDSARSDPMSRDHCDVRQLTISCPSTLMRLVRSTLIRPCFRSGILCSCCLLFAICYSHRTPHAAHLSSRRTPQTTLLTPHTCMPTHSAHPIPRLFAIHPPFTPSIHTPQCTGDSHASPPPFTPHTPPFTPQP